MSSKVLRAPPQKLLSNYVASIRFLNEGEKLNTLSDLAFQNDDFVSSGNSYTYNPYGFADRKIGFNFEINGITYKNFFILEHGYIVLQHPDTVLFDKNNVCTSNSDGSQILSTFVDNEHLLIAPWFDGSYQVPKNPNVLYASGSPYETTMYTSTTPEEIESGKDYRNWPYSHVDRGVRYKNSYDSKRGKYLIVRWTNSPTNFGVKLKFEVAIYENGTIEFRYWPLEYYEPGDYDGVQSTATIGMFWNGTTFSTSNRFRDFSPLLNYREKNSDLGGSTYDISYNESAAPWSNLISRNYWPKNGAIITFSPPTKPLKILPRKLSSQLNSTKEIISNPGMFDDRSSLDFIETSVHMPSNMPNRLVGDTGTSNVQLRQLLFTSGSIQVEAHVNKSVIDSELQQIKSFERLLQPFDHSFNEEKMNYKVTASTSSFYATGSAVSLVGPGFNTSLKSKSKFNFSFPVEKQSIMPPTTGSLYYYDKKKKFWVLIAEALQDRQYKESYQVVSNYYDQDQALVYGYHIYRVFENSVLFDAVGRKVVSGSYANNLSTYDLRQTDISIGSIYNVPDSPNKWDLPNNQPINLYEKSLASFGSANQLTSKEYLNTFTNKIDFAPSESQAFSLPTSYPFLLEKLTVEIPLYISGSWFKDLTTCTKPFAADGISQGMMSGAIDFAGPGLTFSLLCSRKSAGIVYTDIIASGTITSTLDNTSSISFYKDPGMSCYMLRPTGFGAFSNPTSVISGSGNIFEGKVLLELEASVAGGVTISRNDRCTLTNVFNYGDVSYFNRSKAVRLLTSQVLPAKGELNYNALDIIDNVFYLFQSPRLYVQQISPICRGGAGINFSGNSILGGTIASFNAENSVKNSLYSSASGSLPSHYKSIIDSSDFCFESVTSYSLVDSFPSPYLVLPGDKLTLTFSKTRPSVYKMFEVASGGGYYSTYGNYQLTGSHGTVMFNTGSINMTIYGSYIKEGKEYHI